MTKWLAVLLVLVGCASTVPPVPDTVDIDNQIEKLASWYDLHPEEPVCPPRELVADVTTGLWTAAAQCRTDLELAKKVSAIDSAVYVGEINAAHTERDEARNQRWWFGASGFVVGMLLSVLVVLVR